ncbi:MAG: hypothetical protein WC848_05915 [Parcubacteria group bacterium]|jgi:hypothetical protein
MPGVIFYIKDRGGKDGIPETPQWPHGAYNIPTVAEKSNDDRSNQNDPQKSTHQ